MTMNRWKVLACTLTVGVGGLAVFATPPSGTKADPAKEPAALPPITVKPASPVNGDDTQAPAILPVKAEEPAKPSKSEEPVKPGKTDEFEFVVPLPMVPTPPPTKSPDPVKPADLPVFEPVSPTPSPLILIPAAGEETKSKPGEPKKPETDPIPPVASPPLPKPPLKVPPKEMVPVPETLTPEPLKPMVPTSEAPKVDLLPPTPPRSTPPAPAPESPKAPPVGSDPLVPPRPSTLTPDSASPAPLPGIGETGPVSPKPSKLPVADAKLKMLLRIGDGQPRFEIRNSATTELLLKVYGEKIEMTSPPEGRASVAGVMAIGRVKFTAPGIEGTCDHLTILTNSGEVMLKGNIHLKTKYGKSWSEMTADKMVYQIGTTGLSSPTRPSVRPASYIPD